MLNLEASSPFLRVLIVDDHPDLLSMLDLMMQRRQYAVKTALSGDQAMQLAPDFCPHVVVSDIGMPGMDGYQLMQNLRAADGLAPFKSIALTGYDGHIENGRAKDAGYDAHMTKPIEFEQLFEMIEELAREMRPNS
ncbi:Response regulator receiver domain-containing protein [Abditibacterium utsteinense]|uniref:Response regulator receiver domain-containing protein n=1 Tax=Abditibacterium utsteinense TaxID=1960156 RepID=A0A2S8SQV4_9BACT|nr:response regulator [Abditibacterium utsteinense]PQV63192.1 Response regulator receiver domain-containing protein [Abditibacterium utsteinense]